MIKGGWHLRQWMIATVALFTLMLLIPALVVLAFGEKEDTPLPAEPQPVQARDEPIVEVAVYRSKEKKVERLPLEQYVVGVVAAEMPAEFEMEALKAQALTARTYIVKQLMHNQPIQLPEGANVTDTVMHQVYYNDEQLKERWGISYEWKIKKIKEAVEATRGQILTYNNEPIEAAFFSTSNGYTENSEAYWQNAFPYLTSVESPWDAQSPKFYEQVTLSVREFEQRLGVKLPKDGSVGKVLARTPGKRVALVDINGKQLTGREVREKLQLKSTDFTWTRQGNNIVVTTKGYGHGVGMSQYGANFLAKQGKTYKEIVQYYYRGVQIHDVSLVASKF
ncbi:stage II sporulation protein D [Anoxybacillus gonensis]|uniref:Stage II sporulation protein D n=1 Tax=Anoxybacillus gonensis TaxID=198467 RepID=A0AAW7TFL0_9BACL|nr:stage II sporulation protein D [Anoxybacillus gonensis]AKS39600.1 stage II sporulation protein D [Anoxybacillus gonensis]KGP61796.1 stage II sporulation protein D [Anoxybacillus gonensis]MCX8046163.1 stage II sporulation protein D [Anoxybacillus gonensis]MDO0878009.1 stage II sporulation protein D [Anoxybacillus gonensis]